MLWTSDSAYGWINYDAGSVHWCTFCIGDGGETHVIEGVTHTAGTYRNSVNIFNSLIHACTSETSVYKNVDINIKLIII